MSASHQFHDLLLSVFSRDFENPSSKPEWIHAEPETIGVAVDISDDGGVIALLYYSDVSYLEPANMGVRPSC